MGLRLANLVLIDCERTPSKRDPRLRREVRASIGMLIRDIVGARDLGLDWDREGWFGLP